jgi:hypothetical protein
MPVFWVQTQAYILCIDISRASNWTDHVGGHLEWQNSTVNNDAGNRGTPEIWLLAPTEHIIIEY